jgi:hypothetical protein
MPAGVAAIKHLVAQAVCLRAGRIPVDGPADRTRLAALLTDLPPFLAAFLLPFLTTFFAAFLTPLLATLRSLGARRLGPGRGLLLLAALLALLAALLAALLQLLPGRLDIFLGQSGGWKRRGTGQQNKDPRLAHQLKTPLARPELSRCRNELCLRADERLMNLGTPPGISFHNVPGRHRKILKRCDPNDSSCWPNG